MYISVPSDMLDKATTSSNVYHITSIYAQLTDGTKELCAENVICKDLICKTFKGSAIKDQLFLVKIISKDSSIAGNYSEDINLILKLNGYEPSDYRGKMIDFTGTYYSYSYTNFCVFVQSLKNTYNVGVGNLLGIHQWN